METVHLLVELDVKPGEEAAFIEMFKTRFITRSRAEKGCEFYQLWRDSENPCKMTVVEVWSSQADLDTHLAQAWFGRWGPKLEAMLTAPPVVRTLASVGDP